MKRLGPRWLLNPDGDEDAYGKALASWQIENGLNQIDMTPEQEQRYRAIESAQGDADTARHLLYNRRLARRGQFNG